MHSDGIRVVQFCSSALSVCGSVWVLWHTLLKPSAANPFARPHVRLCLIVLLAGTDLLFALAYALPVVLPRGSQPCSVVLSAQVLFFSGTVGWSVSLGHYVAGALRGQVSSIRPSPDDSWRQLRRYGLFTALYCLFCECTALANVLFAQGGWSRPWASCRELQHSSGLSDKLFKNISTLHVLAAVVFVCAAVLCKCVSWPWDQLQGRGPGRQARIMRQYALVFVVVASSFLLYNQLDWWFHESQVAVVGNYIRCAVEPLQGALNMLVFLLAREHTAKSRRAGTVRGVNFGYTAPEDSDSSLWREASYRHVCERRSKLHAQLVPLVRQSYTELMQDGPSDCMVARVIADLVESYPATGEVELFVRDKEALKRFTRQHIRNNLQPKPAGALLEREEPAEQEAAPEQAGGFFGFESDEDEPEEQLEGCALNV